MIGLTTEQRRVLMDKLPDAANLVLGVLALGQFVGGHAFSVRLALAGIVGWLALFGAAFLLGKEDPRE
jgi:hypothetical protein